MSDSPNRRQLLAAGAALAASGFLASARAADGKGRIRKAVKYHMIAEKLSVLDKFKLLKDLGFDGVEFRTWEKIERREVARARDATGLVVHGVVNSTNPDIRGAIDLAKFYGGTSVLVVTGRVGQGNAYDEVYRGTQSLIRSALPHAEKSGVKVLIENVWNNFLLSPLEMARYLDELESPAAGAYFDVGNVVRYGWPEQWIRILGKRIGKLDIKEYSRKKQIAEGVRKGFNVEIGDGDCDWPAVCKALADVGYTDGWATAEVPGGDRARLADVAARMDRALAPLRQND